MLLQNRRASFALCTWAMIRCAVLHFASEDENCLKRLCSFWTRDHKMRIILMFATLGVLTGAAVQYPFFHSDIHWWYGQGGLLFVILVAFSISLLVGYKR